MPSPIAPEFRPSLSRTWPLFVGLMIFNACLLGVEGSLGKGALSKWGRSATDLPVWGLGKVQAWFVGSALTLRDIGTYAETKAHLQREISRLQQQLAAYQDLADENLRLHQLLEVRQAHSHTSNKTAQVIGWSGDVTSRFLLVEAGQRHGVKPDMAVLGLQGQLIGRVDEVHQLASRVTLITDFSFRAGTQTEDAQHEGMVMGQGTDLLWRANSPVTLASGTILLTSENSLLFPSGLSVGVIEKPAQYANGAPPSVHVVPVRDYRVRPIMPLDDPMALRIVLILLDDRYDAVQKLISTQKQSRQGGRSQ